MIGGYVYYTATHTLYSKLSKIALVSLKSNLFQAYNFIIYSLLNYTLNKSIESSSLLF